MLWGSSGKARFGECPSPLVLAAARSGSPRATVGGENGEKERGRERERERGHLGPPPPVSGREYVGSCEKSRASPKSGRGYREEGYIGRGDGDGRYVPPPAPGMVSRR